MTMTWCLRDLKRALGVSTAGEDFDLASVCTDSRDIQKGDIYIARVANLDGHDFVQQAYEKGAAVAVVSKDVDCPIRQIKVPDTQVALEKMADAQRAWAQSATRIAVTGSCGKTSVKEMLAKALGCHKSEASYNNHVGVPLTLARMPRDSKFAVFEVGMNHPGEIAPLSRLVKPHVAIVTAIAPAHIGAFGSIDDIAVEKLSITEGMADKTKLITTLEVYDTYKQYFCTTPTTVSTSLDITDADVKLVSKAESITGQTLEVDVMGQKVSVSLPMVGEHHVSNALLTLAAVHVAGGDVQKAAANLSLATPVEGRGKVTTVNGVHVVDESYNANVVSMTAALDSFKKRKGVGRKTVILGDMLELGNESAAMHRSLAPLLVDFDTVICVGDDMKHLYDALPEGAHKAYFDAVKHVNVQKIIRQLEEGDAVMVKGSKGIFWVRNFVPMLLEKLAEK